MDNDKRKTTSEIIAEMRNRVMGDDGIKWTLTADEVIAFADRLDAALVRDIGAAQEKAALSRLSMARKSEPPTSLAHTADVQNPVEIEQRDLRDAQKTANVAQGDAAAMREALESTEMLLEHFAKPGTMLGGAFALHMRDNRAALSAPARNCDSCDDVDAAVAACMQAIDAAWHEIDTIRATIGWMLAPAEGDGHA